MKVYQGLYCVAIRDFKQAAELFLDTVSTFTSYELMDYKTFVTYTVYVSMIALDRPDLREKVGCRDFCPSDLRSPVCVLHFPSCLTCFFFRLVSFRLSKGPKFWKCCTVYPKCGSIFFHSTNAGIRFSFSRWVR